MQDQVTIFLTTPDAVLFREYQQFHSTFALLCKSGVFDMKNGNVTIHFDSNGTIQKIEQNKSLYDVRIKT
jgi:hypothetical protein